MPTRAKTNAPGPLFGHEGDEADGQHQEDLDFISGDGPHLLQAFLKDGLEGFFVLEPLLAADDEDHHDGTGHVEDGEGRHLDDEVDILHGNTGGVGDDLKGKKVHLRTGDAEQAGGDGRQIAAHDQGRGHAGAGVHVEGLDQALGDGDEDDRAGQAGGGEQGQDDAGPHETYHGLGEGGAHQDHAVQGDALAEARTVEHLGDDEGGEAHPRQEGAPAGEGDGRLGDKKRIQEREDGRDDRGGQDLHGPGDDGPQGDRQEKRRLRAGDLHFRDGKEYDQGQAQAESPLPPVTLDHDDLHYNIPTRLVLFFLSVERSFFH